MTGYQIRPAGAEDSELIAALWHESWHDAHRELSPACILPERTPSAFRQRVEALIADTLVASVASGATIGGFVTVIGDEVDQLFVLRAQRGMGCAAALLQAAEQQLRLAGTSDAVIQCAAGNVRALAFYLKQGYRDTGIRQLPMWRPAGSAEVSIPTHLLMKKLV